MAKPNDKKRIVKAVGDAEVRAAVTRAITENKAHVVLDGRPCSLEVTKGLRGEIGFNMKIYTRDAQEMKDSIPLLVEIKDILEETFDNTKN